MEGIGLAQGSVEIEEKAGAVHAGPVAQRVRISRVRRPIRGRSFPISRLCTATQPAVGSSPSRARCRKMALPRPMMRGFRFQPISMTRS